MSKQKKSGWPSFWVLLFAFTLGMVLRPNAFDKVSMVYVAAVLTFCALPYLLIRHEDAEKMKQLQELVNGLEGGEEG